MHKPLWIAVRALLLAPLAFAQIQNTAPPPLKGVQPQNGAKRQGQPQTPASTDPRLRAPAMRIKLGPPKSGPKISNPHAALRDAAVIAVLQRQRQTAETQFTQMKTMHASAGLPAMQKQPPLSAAAGARVQTIKPGTVSKTGAPPVVGTTKPMPSFSGRKWTVGTRKAGSQTISTGAIG